MSAADAVRVLFVVRACGLTRGKMLWKTSKTVSPKLGVELA